MAIEFSEISKKRMKGFSKSERAKIYRFLTAYEQGGFTAINRYIICGYPVRNKKSDDVSKDDSDFIEKVQHAIKHNLWHYHAGFYNLDNEYPIDNGYKLSNKNDLVSQWLIHYQKLSDNAIFIADLAAHPPMDILTIPLRHKAE